MLEIPNCYKRGCINLTGVNDEEEPQQKCTCLAFPDGIPEAIAYGDEKHLEPIEGDHGIQYQGPENAE